MLTQVQAICALSKLGYVCTDYNDDFATFEKDGTSIEIEEEVMTFSAPIATPGILPSSGKSPIVVSTYELKDCEIINGSDTLALPSAIFCKIQNS